MLLRASSESQGETVELRALTAAGAESGVRHGGVLTRFAEAAVRGTPQELAAAREGLHGAMSPAAVVDAAAVVANFERMVRIADATGIPLDKPVAVFSADLREQLGIDAYGSAANTPPVRGAWRVVARLARPLVPFFMRRFAERRP